MRIHEVKCRDSFFNELIAGTKSFEVRRNDRDYNPGDVLAVNETVSECIPPAPEGSVFRYTGRCCLLKVTYILDDPEYCKEGYVIMGLRPMKMEQTDPFDHEENSNGAVFALLRSSAFSVPCYTEV